jgi:dihydroxyacetone kinase-like predicted kinase
MAKIEILNVGHALIAGARGEAGGAPSKDSIFGVAIIAGNKLVTFGGRRNGMQKFKAYPMTQKATQLERYAFKLTGKDKGFAYTDLDAAAQAELLGATFADDLAAMYYKNEQKKNVNRRAFEKVVPKYKAPNPKKVFPFPTTASVAHAAAQAAKAAKKAAKAAPATEAVAAPEATQEALPLAA